jgi:secretion/DNA translocation related TadE-like protein
MVALVGLAVAVVAWLVLAGSAFVVAHHRAEAVADGAALAGARAVVAAGSATGAEAVACDSARAVAAAQQAYLDDCQVVAFDRFVAVTVQVSVATPLGLPGLPSRLEAVARAGNPGG